MSNTLLSFSPLSGDSSGRFIPVLAEGDEETLKKIKVPEVLPILALRNSIFLPGVVAPINIGRDQSVKLVKDAYSDNRVIGAFMQFDSRDDDPGFDDLHSVGVAANILNLLEMPDGSTTVILQATKRIKMTELVDDKPYLIAKTEIYSEVYSRKTKQFDGLIESIKDIALEIIKLSPHISPEAGFAIKNIESRTFLINYIASNSEISGDLKQELLEITEYINRCERLLTILMKERKSLEIKRDIQSKAYKDMDKQNREYFLQQQMKAIQDELGGSATDQEMNAIREKAKEKKWNKTVGEYFEKELLKLQTMRPSGGEYSYQLTYLQTLVDLPWGEYTDDNLDINNAQQILDADHFGLEDVKERILEHLSVLKLKKGSLKSPIICLYGPPGVGKTSLGKSVARALGREYGRIALGGLHDESEIRGHRRTYIGAMPGRIIQTISKCKTSNPVIVLDEIDKVGNDFRGDPSSALLEVLDPEQNTAFHDNYIDVDYDLSKVLFITTANNPMTISSALKDRMEMIPVTGYSVEEKIEIAKRHILPKLLLESGVTKKQFTLKDATLQSIIELYTRESGVRGLEKKISKLIRHRAKEIATENKFKAELSKADVLTILGPKTFSQDKVLSNPMVGVVTGLAWTEVGGEILFVEASLHKGKGNIVITGNLGDVMKESVSIAYDYIKAHASDLSIAETMFSDFDVHVHVPEGAIPKDGPSAGVAMITAICSAFTGKPVKNHIAMTGEITLRGRVLPVGGVKEKILAAKRAGVKQILLCTENQKDIVDIKKEYIADVDFHYVEQMDEVLKFAIQPINQ